MTPPRRSKYIFLPDQLNIANEIGIGRCGSVRSVQMLSLGRSLAMKLIPSIFLNGTPRDTILDVIENAASLSSPLICQLRGVVFPSAKFPGFYGFVSDQATHSSLSVLLKEEYTNFSHLEWTSTKKSIVILGIAYAIGFLHLNNIAHKRIAPTNILFNADFEPFLSDFFVSSLLESDRFSLNDVYTDPFIEKVNFEADLFSFSIIVCEIIVGASIFSELNTDIEKVKKLRAGERPSLPVDMDQKDVDLISRCWSTDINERPSIFYVIHEIVENGTFLLDGTDVTAYNQFKAKYHNLFNEHTEYIQNKSVNNEFNNLNDHIELFDNTSEFTVYNLRKQFDSGEPKGVYEYGQHIQKSDFNLGLRLIYASAMDSYPLAQSDVAFTMLTRRLPTDDHNEVYRLFHSAYQSFDQNATVGLAFCHFYGIGCEVNKEKATRLFEEASMKSGNFELPFFIYNGEVIGCSDHAHVYSFNGKEIDGGKGFLEKAVSDGCCHAMVVMADLTDNKETLLTEAVRKGSSDAATKLGNWYSQVKKNHKKARVLFKQASLLKGKGNFKLFD